MANIKIPELAITAQLKTAERRELPALAEKFNALAAQWRKDTGMLSMVHKIAMHPAYQKIIGMGKDALPFIFIELNTKGGQWLWALCAITGEDAAKPEDNFRQAVEAWLHWGREHGYL